MPGIIDTSQKLYNDRNEQIIKALRSIAPSKNDNEMIRAACSDVFDELKNTEVQYKTRLVGLREHIHQMVKEASLEPKNGDSRKSYRCVNGNQFTMGGPAACTSISFVSAAIMRQFKQVKDVLMLNWKTIVRDGVILWKRWMAFQPPGTRGFQTLEQIVTLDLMKPVMARLACKPVEYGGYIDGRVPHHIDPSAREEYKNIYISLEAALEKMTKMGRGTVGIVTIGVSSISLWCSGEHENFVMFDSHGDYVSNSHIHTVVGIKRMTELVSRVCGSGMFVSVGSLNATSTYCMYLFEPKKPDIIKE